MREGHPQRPESPYGVAKKAVGDYLHYYREIHGLEYTALAFANVYGPRQDPHGEAGVVAIFAGMMLDRAAGPRSSATAQQTRDFVFVDDVVDAFVRAVETGRRAASSTSAPASRPACRSSTTRWRARHRVPASRRNHAPARAGELQRSALDPGRAEIHLGWKPWTVLDDGVARTARLVPGLTPTRIRPLARGRSASGTCGARRAGPAGGARPT